MREIKPWSPQEIDRLRSLCPGTPHAEIARLLGRTVLSVQGKIRKLNLRGAMAINRKRGADPAFVRRVLQLRASGWPMETIARELNCSRGMMQKLYRRLGIETVGMTDVRRAIIRGVRQRFIQREESAGRDPFHSLRRVHEARRVRGRAFAKSHGWPEHLSPEAVRILNLLWDNGPMSTPQMAEALGRCRRKSHFTNRSERGSHLGDLEAAKMIIRHQVNHEHGGRVNVYMISPWIERKRVTA